MVDKIKTGDKFGKLTVVEKTTQKNRKSEALWLCSCECGKQTTPTQYSLLKGNTRSCGCLRRESLLKNEKYHGYSGTKVHKTWKGIKARCFNKNHKNYDKYKDVGMEDRFKDDFLAFLEEVGEPPADGQKWSLDRIDGSKGYVTGNLRWATQTTQMHNTGMVSTNKTGIKGVSYRGGKRNCYVASWREMDGKQGSKSFSVNKYGEELAMFLAQEYRVTMLERLNLLGAGYTHQHIYGGTE